MKKSIFKKDTFGSGLKENIRATEEFRLGKSVVSKCISLSSLFIAYTFKYAIKKLPLFFKRHSVSVAAVIACWIGIAAGIIFFLTNYTFGVRVVMGEVEVIVDRQEDFANVLLQVENDYTKKTGENFYFDKQPVYSLTLTKNNALSTGEQIYDCLSEEAEISMGMSYGIFIDGTLIGTYPRETDIWELLDRVKERYSDPDAIDETITIDNKVEFVKGMYPKNKSRTLEELFVMFTAPSDNRTVTVIKGDKAATIASEYGMTVAQLQLLNPDYNLSSLKVGTKLFVSKPEIQLDIAVERTVVYTKEISYKTVTTYDKTMFETQSVVTKKGSNGITEYVDRVTLVNGEEVTRKNVEKVVLKAVVNRAVTKGTKSLAPTGKFIFPIEKGKYKITSYYMDKEYYKQFGTWHKALDFGAKNGTPIMAPDSGTVIFADWTSGKGYGYLVKIEHQKGVVTWYGHCSKLAVKKGDKVYQGQVIAYVGSTGNSTGPHLHFEIRVNGEYVNPLDYLK